LLQARPISSLYPLGEMAKLDPQNIYICFNHVQVMTEPMPPAALNIWQTVFPFGKRNGPETVSPSMLSAGGRLFGRRYSSSKISHAFRFYKSYM